MLTVSYPFQPCICVIVLRQEVVGRNKDSRGYLINFSCFDVWKELTIKCVPRLRLSYKGSFNL